jgi:hypothetical protein
MLWRCLRGVARRAPIPRGPTTPVRPGLTPAPPLDDAARQAGGPATPRSGGTQSLLDSSSAFSMAQEAARMSAALPPLKPAPGGARGRRPSPCQVRGTSKNVAQQRQPTKNVRAGQTQHRGCDQGLRERRTRPYKAEDGGSSPSAPTSTDNILRGCDVPREGWAELEVRQKSVGGSKWLERSRLWVATPAERCVRTNPRLQVDGHRQVELGHALVYWAGCG